MATQPQRKSFGPYVATLNAQLIVAPNRSIETILTSKHTVKARPSSTCLVHPSHGLNFKNACQRKGTPWRSKLLSPPLPPRAPILCPPAPSASQSDKKSPLENHWIFKSTPGYKTIQEISLDSRHVCHQEMYRAAMDEWSLGKRDSECCDHHESVTREFVFADADNSETRSE